MPLRNYLAGRLCFLAKVPNFIGIGLVLITASLLQAPVFGATTANANSPLGINLQQLGINSSEIPFLDAMKTAGTWITSSSSIWDTNEEAYVNYDPDGWPTSLTAVGEGGKQQFTQLKILLYRNLPATSNGVYPAGQYVVRYQGEGTITYGFDAVKVPNLSTPGRDVIDVASPTSGGGILLTITSTDPNHTGRYLKNIQLVKAEQENALLAGQVFNPNFLALMRNFRTIRYMGWLNTNGSTQSAWSNRPLTSNYSWSLTAGVPYEVAIQLSNTLSADAWINIPAMATDDYIQQLASLVHTKLSSTQKVYVEFSNEVWNSAFSQYNYAVSQGRATFASGLSSDYEYNRMWFGMRTAQTCDIWKSVWGADWNRVVCVLGAQAANTYSATDSLDCRAWINGAPCSGHNITAVAIAPYFGGNVPSVWTAQSDGGLSSFFTSLTSQNDPSIPVGGWIGQALGWVAKYPLALARFSLPLISYEGGQTFEGFPNGLTSSGANTPLTNLYIAANRDPRMQAAYTTYLQGWKSSGGQLFMHWTDVGTYSQYGEWGALESIMQTTSPLTSAPPKWQALQGFITSTPCWWSSCTGILVNTPMPPTNLSVK